MSFAERNKLVDELAALLEGEWAGARVGASLSTKAPDAEYTAGSRVIQAERGEVGSGACPTPWWR